MLNKIISWGKSRVVRTVKPFSAALGNRLMPVHEVINTENRNFKG